jgi:hypothetical protein
MHLSSVFILRQSRKDRFCEAAKMFFKRLFPSLFLRHSRNKKMYTKIHFDTTLLSFRGIFANMERIFGTKAVRKKERNTQIFMIQFEKNLVFF